MPRGKSRNILLIFLPLFVANDSPTLSEIVRCASTVPRPSLTEWMMASIRSLPEFRFTRLVVNEIMLVRADDQHRTRRVAHDSLGGAADQHSRQAGAPVVSDDDQIAVAFLGSLDDLVVRGSSAASCRFRRKRRSDFLAPFGKLFGGLFLIFGFKLISLNRPNLRWRRHGDDDVQQQHLGIELPGKMDAVMKRLARAIRKIDWDKNAFEIQLRQADWRQRGVICF